MLKGAGRSLQDGQKNLPEKDLRPGGQERSSVSVTSRSGYISLRGLRCVGQTNSVTVTLHPYLNLHLQVDLEVGEQCEEDSQRKLKDLRHRRDAIFGQRHTQILFDGVDKHLVSAKHWAGALQHGEQQLQGDNLGAQLVGPAEERDC